MHQGDPGGRVVVVGSAHPDTVLSVPAIPAAGETVIASEMIVRMGGKGANQAIAAARAGATVDFVGAVGADGAGTRVIDGLRDAGIGTQHLRPSENTSTGSAFVMVDRHGSNAIVVAAGANGALEVDAVEHALHGIDAATVVVLQCEIPVEVVAAVVRIAVARGARVILNLAPFAALNRDILQSVSVLVVNEAEAGALLSEFGVPALLPSAGSIAIEIGARCIVTLGQSGSEYAEPDGMTLQIPAVRAETVVDTTGAGDAYVGTLAARLAAGDPIDRAMHSASAAASFAVTHPGAQPRRIADRAN